MKPPTGDQYHRHLQAGQSTPVETPSTERCGTRGATTIGGQVQCVLEAGHGRRGELHKYDRETIVEQRRAERAAAPAPGAGEGREMTPDNNPADEEISFAWACQGMKKGRKVQHFIGGQWADWVPPGMDAPFLSVGMVALLLEHKWRIKPLPAPAPRVSRVREMVDAAYLDGNGKVDAQSLCERVVEATLEAVQAEMDEDENSFTLKRARIAMLGERK